MKKKIYVGLLALIGFITTIKLAVIYYNANYNPYALSSFCSINDFVDCDGVAKTTTAQFLGVPTTYWGMFFYLFILMLLFADKLKQIKFLSCLSVFKRPMSYISVLGLFAFFVSVGLSIESTFFMRKICILCFFTYILNTLIAIISTDFSNGGFIKSIKDSFEDFLSGVKEYSKHFVIAVLVALIFLTYTSLSNQFTPQVKRLKSIKTFLKMNVNPYPACGNYLGNSKSKIKIELYTDYACPMCFAYSIMMHKLVRENSNIYVESHILPLDNTCNKYLRKQIHKNGCRYAKYAIAAKNQGKYWEMSDLIYEHHPKTDDNAIELAQKLNLNINKFIRDINSKETLKRITDDIDFAANKGVTGTPTIIFNDKKYEGIKPYYELEEIVKDNE